MQLNRLLHISFKSAIFPTAIIISILVLVACLRKTGNPVIDTAMSEDCINLFTKGREFYIKNETDSALTYYYACAGKYSPQLSLKEKHAIADALNNAGYVQYFENCDYTKSFDDLLKAEKIAKESDYNNILPTLDLNIGNIYYAFSDYDIATDYYISAYTGALKEKQTSLARTSLLNVAATTFEHDLGNHYITFLREVGANPPVDDPIGKEVTLGILSALDGNTEAAIEHIEQAERNLKLSETPERTKYALSKIKAKILACGGQYVHAINLLRDIQVPNSDDQLDIIGMLSEYYYLYGDKVLASEYRLKFLEMKDTIQSTQKLKTINAMKGSAEKREMAGRITDLSRKHRFMVIISLTVSAFLVVTLLLLYLIYKSRRKIIESHRELYNRVQASLDDAPTPVNIDDATQSTEDIVSDSINEEDSQETAQSEIPDARMAQLALRIQEIMENSDAIYSSDFSLTKLAQMLDTTTRAISKSINTVYGVNYSSYLAAYRVREACRRMSDPANYGQLTIQAISEELGFKSRSNFITHFKAQTGLTPSEYLKVAK